MPVMFFPSASVLAFFALMIGGGLGVPLGVPPAPEDPLLAQVAPADLMYYARWTGMADPDGDSENEVERLLAEEEVQAFIRGFEQQVAQSLVAMGRRGDPEAALFAKVIPVFGKALITRPTAVFVSKLELKPGGADIEGAMVVILGDAEQDVEEALDTLAQALFQNADTTVEIAGSTFHQFRPDPQAPLFTWGIHEGLFVLGLGEAAVEGVVARAKTPAPTWLVELEAKYSLPRRATLTYANLEKMILLAVPATGDPQTIAMLDSLGLNQLKSYVSVTGLNDAKFISKTAVSIDGEPRGLLALIPEHPLAAGDLRGIPHDATAALAFRADSTAVFETFVEMVGLFEPSAVSEIDERLTAFKQGLGIDVREDLLGSMGDVWQLYTSPQNGGVITGWTATVSVRDSATLALVHNKIVGVINGQVFRGDGAGLIRSSKHGDLTIHSLVVPDDDFFVAPSWCLSGDQLVFALFPQAVKAHVARMNDKSLATVAEVAPLFAGDDPPFALAYYDARALFRTIYPWVQIAARMAAAEMQREGWPIDISILPSGYSIEKHLKPGIAIKRRTPQGIEIESYQSVPGGSIGVTGPVLAAMLLPALQSSRAASYRMQSVNNLKMIALSWHNYHDTYRGLPAAYNTDQEGKPLLSWRVHILPFLGHQDLYDQFHLDEPWSSEHNRKLIRMMPNEYKAPGSLCEPGKTNYLGIIGERAVVVGPKDADFGKKSPIGSRFQDITDGTSNTLGAVEVSDELAVIWTKPDDFEPDKDNPIKGLVGLRPGVVLTMMCDGSVHAISASIDKKTLKALFTRNGGEVVGEF